MSRTWRGLMRAAGAGAGVGMLGLVAWAPIAAADPPGNNGTVKVHEEGTADEVPANEPKVCDFRITGFGFDGGQALSMSIYGHGGPNSGTGSWSGSVTADGAGAFGIAGPSLADGMYRLDV